MKKGPSGAVVVLAFIIGCGKGDNLETTLDKKSFDESLTALILGTDPCEAGVYAGDKITLYSSGDRTGLSLLFNNRCSSTYKLTLKAKANGNDYALAKAFECTGGLKAEDLDKPIELTAGDYRKAKCLPKSGTAVELKLCAAVDVGKCKFQGALRGNEIDIIILPTR